MAVEAIGVLDPVERLNRDLKEATKRLSEDEVRYLVDAYYSIQDYRKTSANQIRAMRESQEPNEVTMWLFENNRILESQIKRALDAYTDSVKMGLWCKSICGIGPVITAGLLAHIDIHKAPTAGNIWAYAGLNPGQEWKKGEKRPWNARLKTLCWLLGESFTKVSNRDEDYYGRIYQVRKKMEIEKNEAKEFADQAAEKLKKFKIGKTTDAYKHYSEGFLPPAHIHARAKRYAVKLFLSHYHWVAHEIYLGTPPPVPYVIEHMGHVDIIPPPNWPMTAQGYIRPVEERVN